MINNLTKNTLGFTATTSDQITQAIKSFTRKFGVAPRFIVSRGEHTLTIPKGIKEINDKVASNVFVLLEREEDFAFHYRR